MAKAGSRILGSEERAQKKIDDLERRWRAHPEDPQVFIALVRAYMYVGRHKQAAEMLEARIREESPPDWDLVHLCCDACRQGGRPDHAFELLEGLSPDFASSAAYWTLRGRLLEDLGRLEEARQEHAHATECDPSDGDALFRYAVVLMKTRREQDAIDCFRRCLQIDPAMTKARINIGVLLDQAGRSDEAIEEFRRAIEASPDSVESHCNLGAAYGDLGRKKEAIAEFRRALEIDPACAMAHFNLGVALMETTPEEAMGELKRAQTLDPGNWEINYNLGLVYFRKGMYELAVKLLQQCVEARPDSVPALYYLGLTFNKKDQPGLAIEQLGRVIALDPEHGSAHFYLGVAYDKKGQFEQARRCYQTADRLRSEG